MKYVTKLNRKSTGILKKAVLLLAVYTISVSLNPQLFMGVSGIVGLLL